MKVLQVVLVTFLWASVLLIGKEVSLPSPVFVFYRVLFSMIVVLPLFLKERDRKPSLPLILSGVLLSLNWIFLFLAVSMIGPSTADFIYYSAPVISLVLGRIFGERIPLTSWAAAAVSFAGTGLIFTIESASALGMFFAFLGAVFYGSVVVMGKVMKVTPFRLTFYQMLVASLFTLPFAMRFEYHIDLGKILLLLIAGVVNTGLALILWWDALKKLGIKTASVLTYLDPLFALVLSIVFLKHEPSLKELVGGGLIVLGGILVTVRNIADSRP